jgi:hypothetical protein
MNKTELLKSIRDGRSQIEALWQGASDEQLCQRPGPQSDWSVKDLIAHLTYWEQTTLTCVPALRQRGERPACWDGDVDETNAQVFAENRDRSLNDIQAAFRRSLEQVTALVQSLSDSDLAQTYPALNGEALWKYIAGETFEHYGDHFADARAWHDRVGLG